VFEPTESAIQNVDMLMAMISAIESLEVKVTPAVSFPKLDSRPSNEQNIRLLAAEDVDSSRSCVCLSVV
jgi:hypothetical protein